LLGVVRSSVRSLEAPGYFEISGRFQRRRAFEQFAETHHREWTSPGESRMPFYLTRFSYTPDTWAKLVKNPEDRRAAAKQYIESVGGKLHGFWYAFGDHDAYNLWEAPDNVSMAATAIAISAGGALSSFHTTVLLTVEETVAALQKAASIRYRPPGQKG
jgi:uncharacterized protein with GYD domain